MWSTACERREGTKRIEPVINHPLPDKGFKARITVENPPSILKLNSSTHMRVKVKNISPIIWPMKGRADGQYKINLAYHWMDMDRRMVVFDGLRTSLPYDIHPNVEVTLNALVAALSRMGVYYLEWDMVQEGVSWFKDKGGKTTGMQIWIE